MELDDSYPSVEALVLQYLTWLYHRKRKGWTDEELEDTDLGWELDHIDHVMGYIDEERKNK